MRLDLADLGRLSPEQQAAVRAQLGKATPRSAALPHVRRGASKSEAEEAFLALWRRLAPTEPEPVREHRFARETSTLNPRPRRFALDFAWTAERVAVEVDGGSHGVGKPCSVCGRKAPGRHTSGSGFSRDLDKLNIAVALGWRVYRCTPETMRQDPYRIVNLVRAALAERRG